MAAWGITGRSTATNRRAAIIDDLHARRDFVRQPSRFIFGRVHANIRKDGRFSAAPRMWGGGTGAHHFLRSVVTHICYTDAATPIVRLYAERSFVSAPPDRS